MRRPKIELIVLYGHGPQIRLRRRFRDGFGTVGIFFRAVLDGFTWMAGIILGSKPS